MMPMPAPPRPPVPPARMLMSESRAEIAAALLEHLAELDGSSQTARARVTCDGITWTADLFGKAQAA